MTYPNEREMVRKAAAALDVTLDAESGGTTPAAGRRPGRRRVVMRLTLLGTAGVDPHRTRARRRASPSRTTTGCSSSTPAQAFVASSRPRAARWWSAAPRSTSSSRTITSTTSAGSPIFRPSSPSDASSSMPHDVALTGVDPEERPRPTSSALPTTRARGASCPASSCAALHEGVNEVAGHRVAVRAPDPLRHQRRLPPRRRPRRRHRHDRRPGHRDVRRRRGASSCTRRGTSARGRAATSPPRCAPATPRTARRSPSPGLAADGRRRTPRVSSTSTRCRDEAAYAAMAAAAREVFAAAEVRPDGDAIALDGA